MITLNEVITRMKFHIMDGSPFGWDIFGPNARYLDFKHSAVIFDTKDQTIYEISCTPATYGGHDETLYWVNPKYEVAYYQEIKKRKLNKKLMGNQIYSCEAIMRLCETAEDEGVIDTDLFNMISVDFSDDLELYETLCIMAEKKMISPERYIEQIVTEYCNGLATKIAVSDGSDTAKYQDDDLHEIDLSEKKPKKKKKNKLNF